MKHCFAWKEEDAEILGRNSCSYTGGVVLQEEVRNLESEKEGETLVWDEMVKRTPWMNVSFLPGDGSQGPCIRSSLWRAETSYRRKQGWSVGCVGFQLWFISAWTQWNNPGGPEGGWKWNPESRRGWHLEIHPLAHVLGVEKSLRGEDPESKLKHRNLRTILERTEGAIGRSQKVTNWAEFSMSLRREEHVSQTWNECPLLFPSK